MSLALKILVYIAVLQVIAIFAYRFAFERGYRSLIGPTEIALLLLVPVVGLFGQTKTLFYAFAFFVPLTAIANPRKLVVRYLLMIVSFPVLAEAYIVGGQFAGSWGAVDFLNLGALVALATAGRYRSKVDLPIAGAVWVLFAAALLFTARGFPVNGVLRQIAICFLAVAVPFYVVAQSIGTRDRAGDALQAIVLGGLNNAVVALFETVRHWPLYQSFYDRLHLSLEMMSATLTIRAGLLRAQGMVGNYETLGLVTGTALIATLAIRTRLTSAGFWLVAGLLAGGCVVSQARSAWVATAAALVVYALYERRWRLLGAGIVGGGLVGTALAAASGTGRVAELLGTGGHGETTIDYRTRLLTRGLEEIRLHPLTGQTRAQLELSMNDLRQGEHIIDYVNTHLHVALIGGLPLFVLWLMAWAVPLVAGWSKRRLPGAYFPAARVAFPTAAIVACVVFVAFTSTTDRVLSLVAAAFGLMSAFARLSGAPVGTDAEHRRATAMSPKSLITGVPASA